MKIGYWSPITATIDWCEENYVVSYYIAEFWNTISNLLMIVYPLIFLLVSRNWPLDIEVRMCFVSLMTVGLGSWMFHMTLLYPMQLMDELPMIWCSCLLLYTVYKAEKEIDVFKTAFLILYSLIFTVMYLFYPLPLFMNATYGFLVIFTTYKSYTLLKSSNSSKLLYYLSAVIYLIGFILWNIDNNFCPKLTKIRKSQHPFLSPFTQLHAWWHLFSGLGSYIFLIFVTHLSLSHKKQDPQCSTFAVIIPIVIPNSMTHNK